MEIAEKSLEMAAQLSARNVALTVLATGFGDMTLAGFAEAIRPLLGKKFPPIEEIYVCLMEDYRLMELADALKFTDTQQG